MTDKHDEQKRPHGQTGDTVQQAAEVSKPTSPMDNARSSSPTSGVQPDPKTGGFTRDESGS